MTTKAVNPKVAKQAVTALLEPLLEYAISDKPQPGEVIKLPFATITVINPGQGFEIVYRDGIKEQWVKATT